MLELSKLLQPVFDLKNIFLFLAGVDCRTRKANFVCAFALSFVSSFAVAVLPLLAADEAPLPQKVLWAWQHKENFEQLDVKEFGIAFFACHVLLSGKETKIHWRDQALTVAPKTRMVPVVRIDIDSHAKPEYSDEQIKKILQVLQQMLNMPNTAEIQIDFDAVQSEREFYRRLIDKVRTVLHPNVPFSITALASWCIFDNWIKDLPLDEAVPMMFSLGRERQKILLYFRNKNDFRVDLCRKSLGISLEDNEVNQVMLPLVKQRKIPVRIFIFTRTAWNAKKIEAVRALLRDI